MSKQPRSKFLSLPLSQIGRFLGALGLGALGTTGNLPSVHAAPSTTRIDVATDGTQTTLNTYGDTRIIGIGQVAAVNDDGRYVAFLSLDNTLVRNDTNDVYDAFVRDRKLNTTTRVSVATDGTQSDGSTYGVDISGDGRYVVFTSIATNLVSGDTNGTFDVFVRDRQLNTTTRVSVANDGSQSNNGGSADIQAISADGRYVVFGSDSSDLVPGDTNGVSDTFIRDRQLNTTTRISLSTAGVQGDKESGVGSISGNGRYVAFASKATNLIAGITTPNPNIYLRDLQSKTTVNLTPDHIDHNANPGLQYPYSNTPRISFDGHYVVYYSVDPNYAPHFSQAGIFLCNVQAGTTSFISESYNGAPLVWGWEPCISNSGRYIAFKDSQNPDYNTENIFVYDQQSKTTTCASLAADGSAGNGSCIAPAISGDGRYVAFGSSSSNLIADDTNGVTDVFLHDRGAVTAIPLISEFRERGPKGANDEYVELFNPTASPLDLGGLQLQYVGGGKARSLALPSGTKIPALGHFLITGSAYSLADYGGTKAAAGNLSLSMGITDGSSLAIADSFGGAIDSVSFGTGGTAGLSVPPLADGQYAFVRQPDLTTYLPLAANGFTFVATDAGSYATASGSLKAALGAPGPENLASPTFQSGVTISLLDPGAGQNANPNFFRNAGATSSVAPQGTIALRRRVTNTTNKPITKLRFRLVVLSTLNAQGYTNTAQADLRAIASPFTTVDMATSKGVVKVYATKPESGSVQNLGGGINSGQVETQSGVMTLSTPLAPGQTRAYNFAFGVQRTGTFTILLLVEAL